MAWSQTALAPRDDRRETRDEVRHRTRAMGPDGREEAVLLVNLSPGGLMVRCEAAWQPGDRLQIRLPRVGHVAAQVRWALGGRVGCQFDQPIAPADYPAILSATSRG